MVDISRQLQQKYPKYADKLTTGKSVFFVFAKHYLQTFLDVLNIQNTFSKPITMIVSCRGEDCGGVTPCPPIITNIVDFAGCQREFYCSAATA